MQMNNEPVAWMVNDKPYQDIFEAEHYSKFTNKPMIPLYTHPADLTDEEILQQAEWIFGTYFFESIDDPYWIEFARAILRKAQNERK
jgi:hypothetical protein